MPLLEEQIHICTPRAVVQFALALADRGERDAFQDCEKWYSSSRGRVETLNSAQIRILALLGCSVTGEALKHASSCSKSLPRLGDLRAWLERRRIMTKQPVSADC
eukprot:4007616-Amphidinium_carterae.1